MSSSSLIYIPPNWVERLSWADVFARSAPIEVDIGCGKGAFLLWASQQHPKRNFFGVDRLLTRLRKVESKLKRNGLANARLFRLEASYFVQYLVPANSVATYHIYCPDPWPKRRHQSRRLVNETFVMALQTSLMPHGCVRFSTDDTDYFQSANETFRRSKSFQECEQAAPVKEALTDFEQQFLQEGKPIHRCCWQKQD